VIAKLWAFTKGLLPSGASLALYAAAAALIAGGPAWTMHRIDPATIDDMKLALPLVTDRQTQFLMTALTRWPSRR
jgi:hypothetical protein